MTTCNKCLTESAVKPSRLPRGWKRRNGEVWCGQCWRASWSLRAITFRLASPSDGAWAEFRASIREAWATLTQLANWVTTECYIRDVRRQPGQDKIPPMPMVYLYPEARERFPNLPSQTVAASEQRYKANYRADRYQVIWTGERSLRNYRYPEPFTAPNKGWTPSFDEQERPVVSVRIDQIRWTLRLSGGKEFRRQLHGFRQLVADEAVRGELAIYRKRVGCNGRQHRGGRNCGVKERGPGNQRQAFDIMVKLVGWFPKQPYGERSGVLHVRTDSQALLLALNAKEERLWVWNADQVRRWVRQHASQLQRWADDQKAENRPPDYQDRRSAAVAKYHRRMQTAVQQAASYVVEYANRRRFAAIKYDDCDQRYVDRFPWHLLRARIKTLCNERSIEFEHASGSVAVETPESLASET